MMNANFVIDKLVSLADEQILIRVEGLAPHSLVKIKAESNDYYCINALPVVGYASTWTSEAIYNSGENNFIDFSKNESVAGDYHGVSQMGLLFQMKPTAIVKAERKSALQEIPLYKNYHISLTAYCDNEKLCETKIERVYQTSSTIARDVQENHLVGRFFSPSNRQARPAIIVLSGSDGRIEKAQNIAQLFAAHGFSTLAVCYFGLEGTVRSLSRIPLECVGDAISFLQRQESVNQNQIMIYGRSKGGEMALLAASVFPQIRGVVANTPSNYVWEGLTEKQRQSKDSSWEYKGNPVAYIPFRITKFIGYALTHLFSKTRNLSGAYRKMLDCPEAEAAKIPVEKINGPILCISSTQDEVWPSTFFSKCVMKQLQANQFPYSYKHVKCQDTGHMLTVAYQPNPRYGYKNFEQRLQDSVHIWEETLAFFQGVSRERNNDFE
jgi:dienelactone hydrolase